MKSAIALAAGARTGWSPARRPPPRPASASSTRRSRCSGSSRRGDHARRGRAARRGDGADGDPALRRPRRAVRRRGRARGGAGARPARPGASRRSGGAVRVLVDHYEAWATRPAAARQGGTRPRLRRSPTGAAPSTATGASASSRPCWRAARASSAPAPRPARGRLRRLHLEAPASRRGLSRRQTELALIELLGPLLEGR